MVLPIWILHSFAGSKSQHDSVYKEYISQEAALKRFFKKATSITQETIPLTDSIQQQIQERSHFKFDNKAALIYKAFNNDQFLGYAIVLDELGKHYPMTFITKITPDFIIDDMALLIYRELYGSEVRKRRFLRQFFGKSSEENFIVDDNITGISGATISSWSIARGAKKALLILEVLFKNQMPKKKKRL